MAKKNRNEGGSVKSAKSGVKFTERSADTRPAPIPATSSNVVDFPPTSGQLSNVNVNSDAGEKKMESLTLVTPDGQNISLSRVINPKRKSKSVIFSSPNIRGNVRFPATAFTAEGNLAPKTVARSKMSKEERAALPKPSLQDRIAKRKEQLARLEKKAAAEQAPAEAATV